MGCDMPQLTLSGGNEIFYSESGAGDPVLLIHGWACDGNDWAWLVADLEPDHRVIAIDNRGHGRSSQLAPYHPRTFAADAAEVIEQLDLGSPLVVAHSMGTIIASTLAVERPELISAMVLIDPVYGAVEAELAPALQYVRQNPYGFTVAAFGQFYGDRTPAWLPVWHRRRILATAPEVVRDALCGLYEGEYAFGLRPDGERYFQGRRTPMLAVYAGSGAAVAEWDRSLPHGRQDEITVWPEHGHFLHQEAPERFAAQVRDWLGTLQQPVAT